MTRSTRFVLRDKAYRFHTIEGEPSERPIVYRVPFDWYIENVRGRLPEGLQSHGFDDWMGPEHSVTLRYGRCGEPDLLLTGDVLERGC